MSTILQFVTQYPQPVVNSIGLLFDIAGAILVAWEVVSQFHGQKLKPTVGVSTQDAWGNAVTVVPKPEETKEYLSWEIGKYRKMKIGLALLLVGFVLQIISNWIPLFTAG